MPDVVGDDDSTLELIADDITELENRIAVETDDDSREDENAKDEVVFSTSYVSQGTPVWLAFSRFGP